MLTDDQRAALTYACNYFSGSVLHSSRLTAAILQTLLAAPVATDAAPQSDEREAAPQAGAPCSTCNDRGMIGGPSYYSPDEGGVPCPDCSAAPQGAMSDEQRKALLAVLECADTSERHRTNQAWLNLREAIDAARALLAEQSAAPQGESDNLQVDWIECEEALEELLRDEGIDSQLVGMRRVTKEQFFAYIGPRDVSPSVYGSSRDESGMYSIFKTRHVTKL
jgi:hypothetical protein